MKVKHKIDIQTQERHKSQVRVSNKKSAFCHLRWDAFRVDNFLKHVDHVIELSVDVTNDNDRLLDSNHVGLVAWKQIRWLISTSACCDEKMKKDKRYDPNWFRKNRTLAKALREICV